jgi:protein TonB
MNRTVAIVASVVLLHLGALWALHSGLLRRTVETVVPIEVLSDLITPPAPRADVPPAPAPATPAARSAPRPAAQAAPQLQAAPDSQPSPNAPAAVTPPSRPPPPSARPSRPRPWRLPRRRGWSCPPPMRITSTTRVRLTRL